MNAPASASARDLARQAGEAFALGKMQAAEVLFRRAIAADGNAARYHVSLGAVLHASGKLSEAREVLLAVVRREPDHAIANMNLGVVLNALGRSLDAIPHHRRAIEHRPEHARAHCNLALALERAGDKGEAEEAFREAVRLDEEMVPAWCGLGRILIDRPEEAESAVRRALALGPRNPEALCGLAAILRTVGRHDESVRYVRKAVRIAPNDLAARLELAQSYSGASRDFEALEVYRKLDRPGIASPAVWYGLAGCYANLGKPRRSDYWFRRALAKDPDNLTMRSAYLFMLAASAVKARRANLLQLRRWERPPGLPEPPFKPVRRPLRRRKLRVGYLSPDFRQHVVRQFFEPVFWNHDADEVEIYCYSEAKRPDMATWVLRAGANRWFRTHGMSDRDVARQIHRDRIDVLVDLAGHTANNRLGVMTWRPAPVQATYLGYFGSTGLSAVDYWIADDVLFPMDTDEPATERLWRLPRCAYAYGVPAHSPPVSVREPDRPVTFGCCNNASKAGMPVVEAWAEILRCCPDSRLVVKDRRFNHGAARRAWRKRFLRRGIDRDRVEFQPHSPHPEYLSNYNSLDIALDPFPRTGGTTTCDALWMGVPVITLAGRRYATRLSATKLTAVGAPELITRSVEEYVGKAVELAEDTRACNRYHETLRGRVSNGPLGDPKSLAKALEEAYREMYQAKTGSESICS